MANYYDFVLAFIPLVFAGTAGALTVFGLAVASAVSVGALAVVPLMGHAMFVRTPGADSEPAGSVADASAQPVTQAAD